MPGSGKGDIGLVSQAAAASEKGDNAALPVEDGRARVSVVGEGATAAVGHDGRLHGRELDAVGSLEIVVTHERIETVQPADGGARRPAVFDDGHPGVAVGAKLRGHVHLGFGDPAVYLEEAIFRVHVVGTVGDVWEHELTIIFRPNVAACAMTNDQ